MIELALGFRDKDGSYAEHAAVVLTSVFRNTSSQINVHILHDETLTDDNRLKITQLATSYNHTVNFYSVGLPGDLAEVLEGASSVNIWTWGSMYRLLLPSLVSSDKIIYLDCDVLVNLDIKELWDIELNGRYLAAAHDQGAVGIADVIRSFGMNPDTYFNSGVILFGLNNIRQQTNWYGKMLEFLRHHPGTTLPDQDILNHIFGHNYIQLDERFNSFCLYNQSLDFNNRIVHFAGELKWWEPSSPGYALYQEYLNLTPWRLPLSHFMPPAHTEPIQQIEPAVPLQALQIVEPVEPAKHEKPLPSVEPVKHHGTPMHFVLPKEPAEDAVPVKHAHPVKRKSIRFKRDRKRRRMVKLVRHQHSIRHACRVKPLRSRRKSRHHLYRRHLPSASCRFLILRRRVWGYNPDKISRMRRSRRVVLRHRRKIVRKPWRLAHCHTKRRTIRRVVYSAPKIYNRSIPIKYISQRVHKPSVLYIKPKLKWTERYRPYASVK
ncbi:glycosyltransferase family 8 protein [Paenibacillus aceti]|uniref:Glycosyltransferase family 8 protein n=1 Tax=Paenibacillus aceti TaxID=1820010 RepID=A0ABQ1VXM6_9BACL|nr:glycosyltransferase family 8 protein [Paenibacillus aceti]GGG04257.1 hypothetical protein GCM10010913_27610 [Paenibacillus aceti]